MKYSSLICWILVINTLVVSCKSNNLTSNSTNQQEPLLFTAAGDPVSVKEFLYVYNKNNFNADSVSINKEQDIKEYLDLYINFKLKVKEAKDATLHEDQAFLDELAGYKKQLAKPYLTEKEVTEKLIQEAYTRMKTEVNASHILVEVSPSAEPQDTLAAYNKILSIREKALNGADFAQLARENSDDPSAKANAGNLGYFTALQMVYPFENAAYNTPKGEISKPVRTRFGYHILKVHDKRPSQGKVKVAHLMIRLDEGMSEEEAKAAKEKIEAIYNKLQQGEEWDVLVRQFSEDRATKNTGGELDWFGTGNIIPSFEAASFALKNKGDISKPVQTPYGWHIIKLIDKKSVPPFEEVKADIEARISRDSRSQLQEEALIRRLKKENNLVENKAVLDEAASLPDQSLLEGDWLLQPDSVLAKKVLFTINDQPYKLGGFLEWVSKNQKPQRGITPSTYMRQLYKEYLRHELIAYEEAHLEDKYEDYRMLVQEYHDGILLFQLMDKKVWTKAVEDTVGLKSFFDANRKKYQWGERLDAVIYNAANAEIIEQLKPMLSQSYYNVSKKDVVQLLDEKKELSKELRLALNQQLNGLTRDEKGKLIISLPKNKDLESVVRLYLDKNKVEPAQYEITKSGNEIATVQLVTASPTALERKFNKEEALNLQVLEGPFERGEQQILEKVSWMPGEYTVNEDGRTYLVIVKEVLPPAPKKLNEVRGQVISDYQNYLEKEWVKELREKYEVKVNDKELTNLLNNIDKSIQ